MMNAVEGTTIDYHAQSWRWMPWDFKTVTEVKKRYGASYTPKEAARIARLAAACSLLPSCYSAGASLSTASRLPGDPARTACSRVAASWVRSLIRLAISNSASFNCATAIQVGSLRSALTAARGFLRPI
jgi:hypothetical protein